MRRIIAQILMFSGGNRAPVVANAIPDQSDLVQGVAWSYQFAENTFSDPDGDSLTYTATQGDGSAVPVWLTFTAATRTFSGTPDISGTLSLKVAASDGELSVSDTFVATIAALWAPTNDTTLAEYFDGRDLSDGAVASWTSRHATASVISEATNRPAASSNIVTFNGLDDLLGRATATAPCKFLSETQLPDASGGDTGKGFTCSGLARAPDGTWWVGNDGRNVVGDLTYESSLVHLSADFTTKLGEIVLAPLYTGIQSIQGVAYDTSDDTLWFADYNGQAIRHVTLAGTAITADQITGLGYAPNGLAYKASNDRLFVGREDNSTIEQRSCVDGTVAATTAANTISGGSPSARDHFWYDAANDVLLISEGANGSLGNIQLWPVGKSYCVNLLTLSEADAVEGIYLDGSTLYVLSDGYFHSTTSAKNRVLRYQVAPLYSTVIDFFAVLTVPTTTGTDAIFTSGDPLASAGQGCGWGIYTTANTGLSIFANTGAGGTTERANVTATVPAMTSYRIVYVRIDMVNDAISIWVDGTAMSVTVVAAASLLAGQLQYGGLVRMGTAGDAASRFCSMTLKALGVCVGSGNRQKFEGYLADAFGLTGNLPADHPYKSSPPTV